MSRLLSAIVGLCVLSVAFAQSGRPVYICEVLFENFCPGDQSLCPSDPTITFGSGTYDFEHFNIISFGNFYAPSGDIEGRALIKGNMDVTSYSFGYQLRTAGVSATDISLPYSIVVGGDAKWHGGSVHPDGTGFPYAGPKEYIYVGGDFSNADSYLQTDRTGSCNGNAGCLNSYFTNAQAFYTKLSKDWSNVPSNTQANIQPWGTIELTCDSLATSTYILNLTPTQFSSLTFWSVSAATCNPNSALVVNIAGAGNQVKFAGATQTFFKNQRVLYNVVPSASTPSVRVEVGVNGNLLAPQSVYNQPGMGVFIGQVIVADVQQVHQVNYIDCQPVAPPPQPPPSTNLCPSFETACAGLDLNLEGATYSFRDFNVISFNDFHANTGDVEGRLAVKRDATFGTGYSVGYQLQTATNQPDRSLPYSLIVGRDLTWGSGSLHPDGSGIPYPGDKEDMYVGRTFSSNQADLVARRTGGPCQTDGCFDVEFNDAATCYTGYSNTIASQTDNVAQSIEWSALILTCNDASATSYYVTLAAQDLTKFTYTTTGNCNFQANWYINIKGTGDVEITGGSFPAVPGGVVYNVVGSRNVYVHDTSLSGHLLAPSANLNQPSGVIVGKVVAGNIQASLQINKQNTCPTPTTIVIPVVVVVPSANGNSLSYELATESLIVGDKVDNAVVSAVDGKTVTFSSSLKGSYGAGSIIFARDSSINSRVATANKTSGASTVSMTIAAIIALIALVL